jgi:ribosomal protein L13E
MHHIKPRILKTDGKQRMGRGFSPDELKKAGLTIADTRRMKVPVDLRRKTFHEENVIALKTHTEQARAKGQPERKPEPKPAAKAKKEKPKK